MALLFSRILSSQQHMFSISKLNTMKSTTFSRPIHTFLCFLVLLAGMFHTVVLAESPWISINGNDAHPTKIIVKAKGDLSPETRHASLDQVIANSGSVVVGTPRTIPNLLILDQAPTRVKPLSSRVNDKNQQALDLMDRIQFLKDSDQFEYVEPNYIRYALADVSDPAYVDGRLWGLKNEGKVGGVEGADIDVDLAWDVTTGSRDVVVAVIDSGIRYSHLELAANMWTNAPEAGDPGNGIDDDGNGVVDDIHGFNAVLQNGDPLDVIDHGTNVASVIGAAADNNDVVGVAQEVSLMAIKALTEFGGEDADLILGIDYATLMGADIINASWGNYAFSQALFDIIAMTQSEGILFVAGAGNDSENNDVTPFYPASHDLDNIISVASFDKYDTLADHSNYGQNSVDIAAPGREIYMAGSGDDAGVTGGANVPPDEDYDYADGTSFAAPHVTGVAVLLKALYPDSKAGELKEMILSSAVSGPAYEGKVQTGGRLNAGAAINVEPDGLIELSVLPASGSLILDKGSLELQNAIQQLQVRVTDILPIDDATVTGSIRSDDQPEQYPDIPLVFENDGSGNYLADIGIVPYFGDITISLTVTAEGFAGVSDQIHYKVVSSPQNDNFDKAQKLPAQGVDGDSAIESYTRFATIEEGEPAHAGVLFVDNTLWYEWSPAASGRVLIDTAGSNYDTVIAVYQGDGVENLSEMASVDQFMGRAAAYLETEVISGETYHIAVGSYRPGRGGSLRLRVVPNGEADWISPVVDFSQVLVPQDDAESIAYFPGDGIVTEQDLVEIWGTAYDPAPSVYGIRETVIRINGEKAGGSAIQAGDGSNAWNIIANLVPGPNTIELSAVDFSGNRSEIKTLFVTRIDNDGWGNDHYHLAKNLSEVSDDMLFSNQSATKEWGEGHHGGNRGGKSLWFKYEATVDGALALETRNRRQADTLIAAYVGKDLRKASANKVLAENDDFKNGFSRIRFAVQEGQTYHIAVDGFDGREVEFLLNWEFEAKELIPLTLAVDGNGSIVPSSADGLVFNRSPILIPEGDEIQLTAIANRNHTLSNWEIGGVETDDETTDAIRTFAVISSAITAVFDPAPPAEDFESGGSRYASGIAGWRLHDLSDSDYGLVMATETIADGQSATLTLDVTSGVDDSESASPMSQLFGSASFDIKVDTEEAWDVIRFMVDGVETASWSGNVDWQTYHFKLPAGTHQLQWVYSKDQEGKSGGDVVYLDNLNFQMVSGEDTDSAAQQPAAVYVRPALDGTLDIEVQGVAGESYVIEASKGLQTWEVIHRGLADSEGRMQLRGVSGGGKAQSFYRAVTE